MRHLRQLLTGIDVATVVQELEAHPELWNQHKLRTTFENTPHQVDDIWLRYRAWSEWEDIRDSQTSLLQPGSRIARFVGEEHESVWYPAIDALPSLRKCIFEIVRYFEVERLGGVLITRIPPGGEVKPHVDGGWHAGYYQKIALQLKSAPGQFFHFGDGGFECEPGTVYAFDNSFLHWVTNATEHERITCIICVRRDQREPPLHSGSGG